MTQALWFTDQMYISSDANQHYYTNTQYTINFYTKLWNNLTKTQQDHIWTFPEPGLD